MRGRESAERERQSNREKMVAEVAFAGERERAIISHWIYRGFLRHSS